MDEYIKVKEVLKLFNELINECTNIDDFYNQAFDSVDSMPTADVVEVKHGRWIKLVRELGKGKSLTKYQCSVCGVYLVLEANYCPNCGAKMDGKGKDDDMLPTEIFVDCYDIDTEWYELEEQEQEEVLSDYLSDTYGFCHYGFCYEESNGKIHITDIEWDEDE